MSDLIVESRPPLLTISEVAALAGRTTKIVNGWSVAGLMPSPVYQAGCKRLWLASAVMAWLNGAWSNTGEKSCLKLKSNDC
jgi:hypothetical protein